LHYLENRWLRALATPPGLLFAGGVNLRNALYRRGWFKAKRIGVPVVSVGNLNWGGSGKTPFTVFLAARFRDAGRRVAIATRGYGGSRRDIPVTVSDGSGLLADAAAAGDEAVLLASFLPSCVVVVCRDRVAAAQFARDRYGSDLILLDDGFQHRRLHRDLDLLLISASHGLGNGRMIPFGPLREPADELRRADAVVLTGTASELSATSPRLRDEMSQRRLRVPLFRCVRRHDGFLRVFTEEPIPAAALKGMRTLAFSGIAHPGFFESDLRALGLEVVSAVRFRDHQAYGPAQLDRIRAAARSARADLLVTTEKDRVRLGSDLFPIPLYALRMRLVAEDEESLWSFVSGRLFDSSAPSLSSRA